jgi:hypothetical protein
MAAPFPARELTPREREAFSGTLNVLELFEAVVVLGSRPDDVGHLMRHAEALVRGLPPDRTEEGLGPIRELGDYRALAWAISHSGDNVYREARAGAGPPSRPAEDWEHPLDQFSRRLNVYLRGMLAEGRAARYRMSGWVGRTKVEFDPGEFVDGNMEFNALDNAIVMGDRERRTGIEVRLELRTEKAEEDTNDEGEPEGSPPGDLRLYIRREEATAFLAPASPLLRRSTLFKERPAQFSKVSRSEFDAAFKLEVPADRRRRAGQPRKEFPG